MASVLSELTSTVTSALGNLPSPENIQDAERMQLLGAIDQLRAALEPPIKTVMKICLGHYGLTSIRVAQGMGIFDAFAAAGGAELTIDDLDAKTKGDRQLLARILRLLAANGILKQTEKEKYQPLPLALMFANGVPPGEGIKHFYLNMRSSANLYDYFESKDYKNPTDAYDAPFQFALNTSDHYFDWLVKHPADQAAFNSVMTLGRQVRSEEWFNYYPVADKLAFCSPERVLLIDIGGGIGHDITEFKNKFPSLPGRLILQDLPQVINDMKAPLPSGVEAMPYSMFEAQPEKGARVYYMRTVLHDWPDKQALEALARIKEAMAQDSILILNENTLPEENVTAFSAALDMTMMEAFGALERTERQWVELLETAGFKVKVFRSQGQAVGDAVFEATL
ncbi:putative O-methyltransferase [Aspergillus steynii IBT 23096]|uniref:Putative O-methyltransferase n=1 Tax=Aspergillus steynii IBT 23096 TaxID=1392250 RepID=A0A2I2FRZ9_9EURO|nr:putative O-methyltransferase [Aspergillus steynii IBT 23096]PLB43410.1 putative O-methyltransferase [Aspergillus steynii IBT 23096]